MQRQAILSLGAAVLAGVAVSLGSLLGEQGAWAVFGLVVIGMAGLIIASRMNARTLAAWLAIGGAFLVDFAPLSLYRYLLWSDVLLLGLFLCVVYSYGRVLVWFPTSFMVVFGAYLASTGLAFSRSAEPVSGVFTWLHMCFLMLVYFPAVTTSFVLRPDLRVLAFRAMLAASALQAGVVVLAVAEGAAWTTGTRMAGAFGNVQAWLFVAGFLGWIAISRDANWPVKLLSWASAACIVAAAAFMRIRMLWVALIVGASLFVFLQARTRLRGLAAVAAIWGALIAAGLLNLYPAAVQARIAAVLSPTSSQDLVARIEVARLLFTPFADSPLIGIGMGRSRDFLPTSTIESSVATIHNVILNAAIEGGIVAGLAIAILPVMLIALRRRALALVSRDKLLFDWAFTALVAIYVGAQFTPSLYEHVFYFLLAFLASAFAADTSVRPPDARASITGPGSDSANPVYQEPTGNSRLLCVNCRWVFFSLRG